MARPNEGEGRIDFTDGTASYISVLTSTYSGLEMDAYDSNNNLIATSGWANSNYGTNTFTRLTIQAPNMAYVLIHDTGNYWLIDDLVADVGAQYSGLGGNTQTGQGICACNGNIYYANSTANQVNVYSQATGNAVAPPIQVGQNPVSLATFEQPPSYETSYYSLLGNLVICANRGDGTLSFINSTTNSVMTTQKVGTAPLGIATNTLTGQAFVTDFENNQIIVLDLRQFPQITTYNIPLNDSPTGIAVDPNTNTVYVSLYNSHLLDVFSVNAQTQTYTLQRTILVGAYPAGLGLDQVRHLWVANSGSASVSMVLPLSEQQASNFTVNKIDFPVASNPDGVAIIDGGYDEGYQSSVFVSYQSSDMLTFISQRLWETQEPVITLTYNQSIPGIAPFNATAAVTIDTDNNTPLYVNTVPVNLQMNSPASIIINKNLLAGPPAFYSGAVYMPLGTYQIGYSIPSGYTYQSLTATGQVTLSGGLTLMNVMGAGTIELNAQQIPNWQNSAYFSVTPYSINMGLIQSVLTTNNGLAQYPLKIYSITASPSTNETQFRQQLLYYFNITVPSNYNPAWVILLHIPMIPLINTILNADLPQQSEIYQLGNILPAALCCGNPYLETDSTGCLNIAITISPASVTSDTIDDLVTVLCDGISTALKAQSK